MTSLRFLKGTGNHLKALSIIECANLTSLEGAGRLNALEEVVLEDNSGLLGVDDLRGLRNLRRITILGPYIRDLSPLMDIPKLELLRLDHTVEYSSFEALSSREALRIIHVG